MIIIEICEHSRNVKLKGIVLDVELDKLGPKTNSFEIFELH